MEVTNKNEPELLGHLAIAGYTKAAVVLRDLTSSFGAFGSNNSKV